jgi:hypothetical protein
VEIAWTATPDVTAGLWLSAIGTLALVGLWLLEQRLAAQAAPGAS